MENKNSGANEQFDGQIYNTTQLDFKQAMQDFKTMFPEMDHDVIEEVLRANQGAVDATIDQLLSMTTDNLNEALRLHLEKVEEESIGDCLKSKSSSDFPDVTKSSTCNSSPFKKWHPPLLGPLPSTFLRIEPIDQVNNLSHAICASSFMYEVFTLHELIKIEKLFLNITNFSKNIT